MTWNFFTEKMPWIMNTRLYGYREKKDGSLDMLLPFTVAEVPHASRFKEGAVNHFIDLDAPSDMLGPSEGRVMLQALMDHLWKDGMRPTGVIESRETNETSLSVQSRHLEDMRALVARFSDTKMP